MTEAVSSKTACGMLIKIYLNWHQSKHFSNPKKKKTFRNFCHQQFCKKDLVLHLPNELLDGC